MLESFLYIVAYSPYMALSPTGSHCVPMGLNPAGAFFFALSEPKTTPGYAGGKKELKARRRVKKKRLAAKVNEIYRPKLYKDRKVSVVKDNDIGSLEHMTRRCQYHIAFAPKYQRVEMYGQIKQDIGIILRKPANRKG